MTATARISEIFSSVQGEGTLLGLRQIFVRFSRCNLDCPYCDEKGKEGRPCGVDELIAEIRILENEKGPHHSISFTGGEPLLESEFLEALLPELKNTGFKIHLETNGVLHDEYRKLSPFIDYVSMDIKLPALCGRDLFREHDLFLGEIDPKRACVKIIISPQVNLEEFDYAAEIVSRRSDEIPVILQPMDEWRTNVGELLLELQSRALRSLKEVLVIPRVHKELCLR